MGRRRWITLSVLFLTALVSYFALRPKPLVTVGPHRHNIRFVSFNQAHAKPWIDVKVPLFGRFTFPVPEFIEGVPVDDDARFVAGYLIVNTMDAHWRKWDCYVWGYRTRTQSAMPVLYPDSPAESTRILFADSEEIPVHCDFDPERLPARIQGKFFKVGDVNIHARLLSVQGRAAHIDFKLDIPDSKRLLWIMGPMNGGIIGSAMPRRGKFDGLIDPSGAIIFRGRMEYADAPGGKVKRYPFEVVFKPVKATSSAGRSPNTGGAVPE